MNHFEPSIERAQECRLAMDELLWDSVRDLLADAGEDVPDPAASDGTGAPTGMLDYAAYFDLSLPVDDSSARPNVDADAARAYLRKRLAGLPPLTAPATPAPISNLSGEYFTDDEIDRMHRWWDIEPANRMSMVPADPDEFARLNEQVPVAMDYLRLASEELHGEIETIIRDIVLTKPDGKTNRINYSGASSFALWGALTINAETQREWMQSYRQIVHETGHNLLFGIARDEPLVSDDPAERMPSAIRADPRPADGVFHAAYVSAREALAFDLLLTKHDETGCLPGDDPQILEDMLELSVLAFWDCVETLRSTAKLTGLGDRVLADCEAYMTENFAIEPV